MLLDVTNLGLRREVGSPEQSTFGTMIFVFVLFESMTQRTSCGVVDVIFSSLFFYLFFGDGTYQISVTNRSSK